jgi:hypothetical protein
MSARLVAPAATGALMGAVVLVLAGCVASPPTTTTRPVDLAATVANSLTYPAQLIDCGAKKVPVVDGGVARCRLTEVDKVYAVTIRFSKVEGTKYSFDATVAKSPESTLSQPGSVRGDAVAQLAAQALAPRIGFTPQLTCRDRQVPLTVGYVEKCAFSAEDGRHVAEVTVSRWDGTDYSVTAKVVS